MVELGVDRFRALRDFKAAAATVQVGNKVCPASSQRSERQHIMSASASGGLAIAGFVFTP